MNYIQADPLLSLQSLIHHIVLCTVCHLVHEFETDDNYWFQFFNYSDYLSWKSICLNLAPCYYTVFEPHIKLEIWVETQLRKGMPYNLLKIWRNWIEIDCPIITFAEKQNKAENHFCRKGLFLIFWSIERFQFDGFLVYGKDNL